MLNVYKIFSIVLFLCFVSAVYAQDTAVQVEESNTPCWGNFETPRSFYLKVLNGQIEMLVEASCKYHTLDIEDKFILFLFQNGEGLSKLYYSSLMYEAMEGIGKDLNILSETVDHKDKLWFWVTAEQVIKEKYSSCEGIEKLYAFIKIKKATLNN